MQIHIFMNIITENQLWQTILLFTEYYVKYYNLDNL